MTEARVEFDYVAQQSDELTINKGEIITNIKQMDGGWWEGNLRGKRGVFPDNFVKVLNPVEDKNAVIQNKGGARYCRALFSYTPVNEDELELHENDVIEITGEVEEGWWRGVLKGKDGVFPSNFVKEEFSEKVKADTQSNIAKKDSKLDSNEPPTVASRSPVENESLTLLPKPNREMCRVRFPYLAVNADELTLDVGDVVTILSHNTQEPGWWKGELNGKIGVFPDNFVEIISPDEKSILSHTTKVQVNTATNPLIKTTVSSVSNIEPQSTKSQDEICSKGSSDLKPQPLGKKPAVLPPYKKPPPASALTKLSPGPPLSKPSVGSNVDTVDGTTQSRQSSSSVTYESPASTQQSPPLVTNQNVTESPQSSEFDNVERTAMLSHPTVTRAKAPRRRPPSAVFKDSANVTMSLYQNEAQSAEWSAKNEENMFNGNVESMRANENDVSDVLGAAFSTAAPTTNVPTREFERSAAKILLVEELRQNQARNRKTQMEPPQPPATEKKPSLPLTLPTKPSEVPRKPSRKSQAPIPADICAELARLKPVPAQPPQVSSRSSQSDSSLLPPLSIPRRTSPSAEIATPPLHSVTLKRHSENVSQTKPANGFKPFSESQPVASQRPSSAALLRDGEIQKRPSGVVLNRDNETQEQDKITKLEQQVQEMQNTITRMAERFENAIKDERLKRIALEAEVERLKALASVV